jgi:predicted MPP superfamily phosphohydrolase
VGASPITRTLGTAALAAGAGLAWAVAEAHWFTLRRFTVPVLPAGQRPLRVLHLSDLHLTPGQDDKIAWVRALADLEPDLVVDTGDNWAHAEAMPALAHALDPLLGVPGAFVMGSNDYYGPAPKNPARYLLPDARRHPPEESRLAADDLARLLTGAGWVDLDNRRGATVADGRLVSLVGVDDAHLDRDRFPDGAHDPDAALRLGVTHAPYQRVLDTMVHDGVDLILAGHTHGGQLALPGWGALVTNCDLDTHRAKGLHGWPGARPDEPWGEDSVWLHVSAGLGTSPFAPVRFACRPEATLLTLVAR